MAKEKFGSDIKYTFISALRSHDNYTNIKKIPYTYCQYFYFSFHFAFQPFNYSNPTYFLVLFLRAVRKTTQLTSWIIRVFVVWLRMKVCLGESIAIQVVLCNTFVVAVSRLQAWWGVALIGFFQSNLFIYWIL